MTFDKTFSVFLKIRNYVESKEYAWLDIHLGNMLFEMDKSLTIEEMEESIKFLRKHTDKKIEDKKNSLIGK